MKPFEKINCFLENKIGYKIKKVNIVREKSYREQLVNFIEKQSNLIKGNVLDIGTGKWTWTIDRFKKECDFTTFDQIDYGNIDIVGDLLNLTDYVESDFFDAVLCLDVIEHVKRPFQAVNQIYQVLKKDGIFIGSTPFLKNLHGEEYGDYWRITRQGWKELLKDFSDIKISWGGDDILPKFYFIKAIK